MDAESIGADTDQPVASFRQELDLSQVLTKLKIGRPVSSGNLEVRFHNPLLPWFATVFIAEFCMEFAG